MVVLMRASAEGAVNLHNPKYGLCECASPRKSWQAVLKEQGQSCCAFFTQSDINKDLPLFCSAAVAFRKL